MKRRLEESDDELELDSEESESEFEIEVRPKAKRARKATQKPKGPSTKAQVTVCATDTPPDVAAARDRVSEMGDAVLSRIRKMLALATHEGTGEAEAKAALRKATKLLNEHSVTQADVLAHETEAEKLERAGQSVVAVCSTVSQDKPVVQYGWVGSMACAIDVFFNCQHYSTKFDEPPKIEWTFYGLAEQTVAAAHAFAMVNESSPHDFGTSNFVAVLQPDPRLEPCLCYCSGVARGLNQMANEERENAKKQAAKKEQALLKERQEQEAAEDKSRLERLRELPAETKAKEEDEPVLDRRVKVEEVEDEDSSKPLRSSDSNARVKPEPLEADPLNGGGDDDDDNAPFIDETVDADFDAADNMDDFDIDAELEKAKARTEMPPPPPAAPVPATVVPKKEEEDDESPWASVQQLVQFRETSIAIGDDFLKQKGIKLHKARKRQPLEFKDSRSSASYHKGKKDARNIDVRRRQITDGDE
ncbi:DUF2786 domain-containing protein [Mycena chlorophos]|uniref:DUF2786 domain-containing protein n=1 Tax=Mycena chlorophos TaxID=658473 RepID=A0A8H6RYN5_MYCCL|nr:DUF2786 domain-containing protein [Mycena chlorophos]